MLFDVSRIAEIADHHSYHVIDSKCLIYRKDTDVIGYDLNQGFPHGPEEKTCNPRKHTV